MPNANVRAKAPGVKVSKNIEEIDLHQFCPKQIFDILFVSEADEWSREVLDKVFQVARNYEDISCLTIITYDEVLDILDNRETVNLPPYMKVILKGICEQILEMTRCDMNIPSSLLAKLMKLKLIEVMYHHYIKEVTKMMKRKKLEQDLEILTKDCKGIGDKGKGGKAERDSKKGSTTTDTKTIKGKVFAKTEEKIIEDYTKIKIENENSIIFDDDIFNHVWFYVFQGFYDPHLLYELNIIKVPLTAAIKLTATISLETTTSITTNSSMDSLYEEFWTQVYKYFDGSKRLTELENTILMKFCASGEDFKQIFQELLYIIKNISDIKLQHINYVRHLQIYDINDLYNYFPLECLTSYTKIIDKIPFELTNEQVLLTALLKEVYTRVDNTKSTTSILENLSRISSRRSLNYFTHNCVNPCGTQAFFRSRQKIEPEKIIPKVAAKNFLTHECDEINIILNSYKKYGPLVCNPIINLFKVLKPLTTLDKYATDHSETTHKHDTDPSTKTVSEDEEMIMHIFYLIFFSAFDCKETVTDFEGTELTENLQTYDKTEYIQSAQTVIRNTTIDENTEVAEEDYIGEDGFVTEENYVVKEETGFKEVQMEGEGQGDDGRSFPNYYVRPALHYYWREQLTPDVLLQEIYKAHNEFLYMEQRFSPGTDNLLVQFSNCLDEFGINTKIYEQSLITPICLRDFCRFVTVEKASWLENNKPPKYFRKCEDIEVCKGVNRINQLQLFPEYSHLLESTIKTEETSEENLILANENTVTFDHLKEELKNYPTSEGIANECRKSKYRANFLAYDLGSKYFQVRGARTTFHSHDDVKITVDNTKFLDEEPKCTVDVACKGNNLILHSNKFYLTEDYTYNMHLFDGTLITFIVLNPSIRKRKPEVDVDESVELTDVLKKEYWEKGIEEEEIQEAGEDVKVISVDEDYFKGLEENRIRFGREYVQDEENLSELEFKDNEAIYDSFRQAAAANCPIYKVNKNLRHLKKLTPTVEIPLTNILHRILHKTIKKKDLRSLTKRYLPKTKKHEKPLKYFDARIALPNGLYITFYPSEVKNAYMEVKQEFLTKNLENSLVELEEFRLFTREGHILIKYIDGTIRILKSNGDTIDYEKLDASSDLIKKWRLRPCHCKNTNDYRKKLNRMMRRNYEPDPPGASISRRAQFKTKKGYILKSDLVNMLEENKVPYLKHNLIKFNGNRVCLENGKVTQKRLFHITDEQDFFAQEIYYERSDGFRSYFDKNGRQQVKFADGTKISSTIHVTKQLVDGYVYISLNFQYEHPNYATVLYSFDNSLDVVLNNAVFKRDIKDVMTVKVGEAISTTVNKDRVDFQKTCLKCSSTYKCCINVHPFCKINVDKPALFLHAMDSYNKQFYCDYAGNCQRNIAYIKGAFNAFNCNHTKRRTYKKMFVVNRNYSGYTFWTNNMVDTKRKNMEKDENVTVKICADINNPKIDVVKLRRRVFDQYNNRFLNTDLLKEQMCLTKYKQPEVKQLFYTTSRIIKKVTDYQGIKKCLSDIMMYFKKFDEYSEFYCTLDKLSREEEENPDDSRSFKEIIEVVVAPQICKCPQVKLDTSGKILRWRKHCRKYKELIRKNVIVPYFESEFCQIVDNKSIVQ